MACCHCSNVGADLVGRPGQEWLQGAVRALLLAACRSQAVAQTRLNRQVMIDQVLVCTVWMKGVGIVVEAMHQMAVVLAGCSAVPCLLSIRN